MLHKLWNYIQTLKSRLPLIYSILLIILVPATLVLNTWWNLRAFERDMNFAIREQALTMQNFFTAMLPDQPIDQINFDPLLVRLQNSLNSLVSATILQIQPDGQYQILSTTDPQTGESDRNLFLNSLVWQQETTYFTQTFHPETNQNLWMAVSPLYDQYQNKIGLTNFKITSQPVDDVIARTIKDSLIILTISVIVVVLLLINHLKFFQQSLFVEKLKQLDQMKDDFISVASHELRTPLTAIKSYAAMMAKDFQGKIPEKIKKRMDIINFSIQRLEQLINDLLNVSRLEQGKLDFQLSPVNTDEIITEIINQLRVTAEQKQLQLNYNARPDLQSAQSHPDRLREVLLNLIGNAIKYTKQGQVQITQKQENNKLYILIQDTGIGISPEDREKLFQKFSRIRNEQTQDISGTGLGLWITKTIVEKMQGKIYLDSVIGQGTVVTVILPIASP